jgi:hypothetical protein
MDKKNSDSIISSVRLALQRGESRESIVGNLINSGYEYHDIERAFGVLDREGVDTHPGESRPAGEIGDADLEVERVAMPDGFMGRLMARVSYYRKRMLIPAIVLLLVAAAGLVAYQYYQSSTDIVMGQTTSNFQRVQSLSFAVSADMDATHVEANGIALADNVDPKLSLSVKVSSSSSSAPWDISIVRPGQGKLFFKANSIESLDPAWRSYAGEWIEVAPIGDWQGKLAGTGIGPVIAWTSLANDLSGIKIFHVRDLFKGNFIEGAQLISRQGKDGRKLYTYRMNLSSEFRRDLISAVLGDSHGELAQRLIDGTWDVSIDRNLDLPYQIAIIPASRGGLPERDRITVTFSDYGTPFPSLVDASSLDLDAMLRWMRNRASLSPAR